MEAEIAVITDDVRMGVSSADAASHIKLVMLVNDVSLRGLIPAELAKGFGFFQSKPATSFSPVAVTLDELGDAGVEPDEEDYDCAIAACERAGAQAFGHSSGPRSRGPVGAAPPGRSRAGRPPWSAFGAGL